MAYKSLEDIIDVICDSVDVVDIIKPVYNFKAAEVQKPWKKINGIKFHNKNICEHIFEGIRKIWFLFFRC